MARTINLHDLSKLSSAARAQLLARAESDLSEFEAKVKPILAAVRAEGDVALARFAQLFDKAPVSADALGA
jgi:histidinol dehydrogenase